MPAYNDPTSPIGRAIPLKFDDIKRLRSSGNDQTVAARAYDLDPSFRSLSDHFFSQDVYGQLDEVQKRNLPTLLLNKHYTGSWEETPVSDVTAAVSQPKPKNLFTKTLDVATAPVRVGTNLVEEAIGQTAKGAGVIAKGVGLEGVGQQLSDTGQMFIDQTSKEQARNDVAQAGQAAKYGLPIAAGIATAGASLPIMAGVSAGAGALGSVAKDTTDFRNQTAGQVIKNAAIAGTVDAGIDVATFGAGKALKALKKTKGVDGLVGETLQATPKDMKAAKKGLETLNTEGVKSYDDLLRNVDANIDNLVKAQDLTFSTLSPAPKKLDELSSVIKVGDRQAVDKPIENALNHLEELYSKKGAVEDVLRIQNLKENAVNNGLNAKDVNAIAREYGFNSKSFTKKGDPITTVNAELYENTRSKLKTVARNLMPDETTKLIDDKLSQLYTVKQLTQSMVDAVQKLQNKVEPRGVMEMVGRGVGQGVDAASGRLVSGLLNSFVKSNVGLKTMNSLDLEKKLAKNLKLIKQLTGKADTLSDSALKQQIQALMKGFAKSASVDLEN